MGRSLPVALVLMLTPAAALAQQQPPSTHDAATQQNWQRNREGRPLYIITRDYTYCHDATGDVVLVQRGFETDYASIPASVRWLLPPNGPYARAAIVHDWLYALGTPGDEVGRKRADAIFLAAMVDYEVPSFTRGLVYRSVRAGGKKGYGLPGDWTFADPATFRSIPPPAKGSGFAAERFPGCEGYTEAVVADAITPIPAGRR